MCVHVCMYICLYVTYICMYVCIMHVYIYAPQLAVNIYENLQINSKAELGGSTV